jgi:hypothetical protein
MSAASPSGLLDRTAPSLAQRAAAILRAEVADGALDNIGVSERRWSAARHDLLATAAARPPGDQVEQLVRDVLDLVAPAAQPLPRHAAQPLPALRATDAVRPGGTAVVSTTLQNDHPNDIDVGFTCSDLVAEPGHRIAASRLRMVPERLRIPAGRSADLAIILDAPDDTPVGTYRALLQAVGNPALFAVLTFPVGFVR